MSENDKQVDDWSNTFPVEPYSNLNRVEYSNSLLMINSPDSSIDEQYSSTISQFNYSEPWYFNRFKLS